MGVIRSLCTLPKNQRTNYTIYMYFNIVSFVVFHLAADNLVPIMREMTVLTVFLFVMIMLISICIY